jgi:hypothetical protein
VYHTLLFFHVLAAFALVATVVILSAFALGWSTDSRVLTIGRVLWAIGGLGTLGFGVWLALYVQGYEIYDGWIIAAIVLWAIATELGRRAEVGFTAQPVSDPGASAAIDARQAALWHWLRSIVVLALLVVMIFKPGA